MSVSNLLLELGTEELPPKALRRLAEALAANFTAALKKESLSFETVKWYATPRRLALYVKALADKQPDQIIEIKGPSVKAAFNADGTPTKAAEGWAKSHGIDAKDAEILKTDKGEWLYIKQDKPGTAAAALVPDMFRQALAALPIPKLMHWGDKREEFVRPVHTLCMLYGDQLIPGTILGVESSKIIRGHRFLGQQTVTIDNADSYVETLRSQGAVIADYDERKAAIKAKVAELAASVGGEADLDDDLLEEVTSLVENPHAFLASFEERFLQVPAEALVYTMKGDQKYFPIYSKGGKLLPKFVFVANINPADPSTLIAGNERVVRPRLTDAEFFFKTDRKHSLEYFYQRLENIVYQKDIGTIAYRSTVVADTAAYIASLIGADENLCRRAAHLAKCDLATTLVTEFTDTQGIMGMHYAELDGEDPAVSKAIFEQYLPRFAGDAIPTEKVPMAVSLAEKAVTLTGIFGINMLPKGDKDPYGLRRAAIGLIRIAVENGLNFSLRDVIAKCAEVLGDKVKAANTVDSVCDYVFNRLKAYYQDRGIGAEIFQAVLSVKPQSLVDFDQRVKAVQKFKQLPEAEDLAAAYKRVNNILSKADVVSGDVNESLLQEAAEQALVKHILTLKPEIDSCYQSGSYEQALTKLAELRTDVDSFFEQVMVNAEDPALKQNRLLILSKLAAILSTTADISVLY